MCANQQDNKTEVKFWLNKNSGLRYNTKEHPYKKRFLKTKCLSLQLYFQSSHSYNENNPAKVKHFSLISLILLS